MKVEEKVINCQNRNRMNSNWHPCDIPIEHLSWSCLLCTENCIHSIIFHFNDFFFIERVLRIGLFSWKHNDIYMYDILSKKKCERCSNGKLHSCIWSNESLKIHHFLFHSLIFLNLSLLTYFPNFLLSENIIGRVLLVQNQLPI